MKMPETVYLKPVLHLRYIAKTISSKRLTGNAVHWLAHISASKLINERISMTLIIV